MAIPEWLEADVSRHSVQGIDLGDISDAPGLFGNHSRAGVNGGRTWRLTMWDRGKARNGGRTRPITRPAFFHAPFC
jgi:hypothetical protein